MPNAVGGSGMGLGELVVQDLSGAAGWLVDCSESASGQRRVSQLLVRRAQQPDWLVFPAVLGDDAAATAGAAAAVKNAMRGPNKATPVMSDQRVFFHERADFLFRERKIRFLLTCT